MASKNAIVVDGRSLSLEDVERVATGDARVVLDDGARERMFRSRQVVNDLVAGGHVAYGITTGFGKLSDRVIPESDLNELQVNLLRSHAVGTGPPFDAAVSRAIMLLRANTLALGLSGVRPVVCERLLELLNTGIVARIPSRGSVGASGDLAPLAHLALVVIGEGDVLGESGAMSAASALELAGIEPLVLEAKEGLSLINGTQAMTAIGTLTLLAAERVLDAADVAGALSLEATCGTRSAFRAEIHTARPHAGQVMSASRLRELLGDASDISRSHENCGKVQDPYSFRCMPQVHGAARDAVRYARGVLETEINAGTDNPLVLDGEDGPDVVSGGNFHGAPVAAALDFLSIGLTDVASISERRIEALIDSRESGLPDFLAAKPGLESGFMAHQIAAAALVSECKTLAQPASVDSIPTNAGREDHVSMGAWAARKAATVVEIAGRVVTIELIAAARGIDLRRPLRTSPELERVHAIIRDVVAPLEHDRAGSPDIERLAQHVEKGVFSS